MRRKRDGERRTKEENGDSPRYEDPICGKRRQRSSNVLNTASKSVDQGIVENIVKRSKGTPLGNPPTLDVAEKHVER